MIEDVQGIALGMQTLVGYRYPDDTWPKKAGNCFSLQTEEGSLRIVNFNVANFNRLLDLGLTFPFRVRRLAPGVGALHDVRIPSEWYDSHWCSTCCPRYLLPMPQQLDFDRNVELGNISLSDVVLTIPGDVPRVTQIVSYRMPFAEPVLPSPP